SLAALELGRDVGDVDPFQGLEVELLDPRLVDELADQLFDQPRVREQSTVAEIVLTQRSSFALPVLSLPGSTSDLEAERGGGKCSRKESLCLCREDLAASHLDQGHLPRPHPPAGGVQDRPLP